MSAFLLWIETVLADLLIRYGAGIWIRAFEWYAAIQQGAEGEA